MDPLITSALIGGGSSLASSALSLFGKRGPSERDLMHFQHDFHKKGLREFPNEQMIGLRRAGLNPMLAVGGGQKVAGGMTPSIAAPVDKGTDAAKLLMTGLQSAVDLYRAFAEVDLKKEQTKLTGAQTETEAVRPGSVLAQTARDYEAASLSSAMNAHEKQKMGRTMIQMAIDREALTVAEKDAIIAAIDLNLYQSTIGEVSRTLQQLGFTPGAARGAAAGLLKLFGVGARSRSAPRRE